MKTKSDDRHFVAFYVGKEYDTFFAKIKENLVQLEKNNISYVFFEEQDRIMPVFCSEGYCVAGLDKIKSEIELLCTMQ